MYSDQSPRQIRKTVMKADNVTATALEDVYISRW
jgi:hypothetical protein